MIAFGPYGSHFGGNHFKFQGLKFARALHFKDIVYISPKKVMFWTTFFIIINIIFFIFYFFIYENTKTLYEICFDWRFGVTLFSPKFTKDTTFFIYC